MVEYKYKYKYKYKYSPTFFENKAEMMVRLVALPMMRIAPYSMIRMFWVLQIAPLHHVQWQLVISTVSRERASRQHGLSTGYTITSPVIQTVTIDTLVVRCIYCER